MLEPIVTVRLSETHYDWGGKILIMIESKGKFELKAKVK